MVGETRVIAGVFQPLRRRIQTFVDARFNRRLVDCARTIDRFSPDLRGWVEQEAIATRLRATAYETVEPRSPSVWIQSV